MRSRNLLLSFAVVFAAAQLQSAISLALAQGQGRPAPKSAHPAAKPLASGADLRIQKAIYGDLPDGMSIDVTEKVRTLVKNGSLDTTASDSIFGDPYNGSVQLQIIQALAHVKYLNLGGPDGAGDITDKVKGFQNGNHFGMKMDGDVQITVDYRFGSGDRTRASSSPDGSITIDPPTKLRIYYAFNGTQACKIADLGDEASINSKNAKPIDLATLIGAWAEEMFGEKVIEVAQVDGNPTVAIDGFAVSDVKFECGRLTFRFVYPATGWRFAETIIPGPNGYYFKVQCLSDGKLYSGTLLRK